MRVESKSRASEQRSYRERVKVWIVGKECQARATHIGQSAKATECHHTRGKRGRLLNYEPFWLPVCSGCHTWIHQNIPEAREAELICELGQWNKQSLVPI